MNLYIPVKYPLHLLHYGHFIRDSLLNTFCYLSENGYLDNPSINLTIGNFSVRNRRRSVGHYPGAPRFVSMPPAHKQFLKDIFPGSRIWKTIGYRKELVKDLKLGVGLEMPYEARPLRRPNGDSWGGDSAMYPKLYIDKFRDYVFSKYDFSPDIKKRILYVPRSQKTGRYLYDSKLKKMLKDFCLVNDYEFLEWENNKKVSIFDQIKAYSESEIVIGGCGADFVNSYWMNESQLIITIIPPSHYEGHCAPFYSDSIFNYLKGRWSGHTDLEGFESILTWPEKRQVRDWHLILSDYYPARYTPRGQGREIGMYETGIGTKGEENRGEILKILGSYVSNRLNLSQ